MGTATTLRQEIDARNKVFEAAFGRNDMAALAALYAEDAYVLPPGSPQVQGRPAIQQFWQAVWDSGFRQAALQTGTVEGSGELAYEVSTASLATQPGDGQATTLAVKYVVVWRRAGGTWLMVADIWNTDS